VRLVIECSWPGPSRTEHAYFSYPEVDEQKLESAMECLATEIRVSQFHPEFKAEIKLGR
jgi:hypothetical protein